MKQVLYSVLRTARCKVWILAGVLSLVAAGCSGEAERAAEHREAAEAFLEAGETAKAVIELENLVQLDPSDADAFHILGEARLVMGRFGPAYEAFRRAALLDPGNLEAQLKLGQLNLFAGRLDNALEKAQLVLARSESHPGALALLADVRRTEGDLEAAVEILNRVVSLAPDRPLSQIHLARIHLSRGELGRADEAFQRAAEADPSLQPLLAEPGGPYATLPVLACYHETMGDWKEAESAYRAAAESASAQDVSPLLDLAAFYARRGAFDRAVEAVDRAATIREHDLDVRVHKAEILAMAGAAHRAEAEVARVLEQYEAHVGANLLQGKLLLSKEAWNDALPRFERVVRAKPRFAAGYYYRGFAQARMGEPEPALESLEEAARLDPDLLRARVLLAELYLEHYEKGHLIRAREHILEARRVAPRDPRVLTLLGNLFIREQDLPAAEEALRRVTRLDPAYPLGQFRLGFVYHLMGRQAEALERFRAELDRDPCERSSLAFGVRILLADRRFPEAMELCDRASSHPTASSRVIAAARYLKGKALLERGDREAAERELLSAVEAEPNLPAPHVLLTLLYLEENRGPDLIAYFERIAAGSPEFLPAYMVIGMAHDREGNRVEANAAYRRALAVRPDFAPAANNLAWNLATGGGNLDQAFALARTAKSGMPEDPHVSDTMGWIYHRLGHQWKAVAELEHAVSLHPHNPVFNYHLGAVYLEAGEPQKAKAFLKRALRSGSSFPGAEEAKRLIESLEKRTAQVM